MNVEIETETAYFPEKEYINGIFLAVQDRLHGEAWRCHYLWCNRTKAEIQE